MIGIEITGDSSVIAKLGEKPAEIRARAKSSLDAWAMELAGYIKASKLSGQVLNRRKGRLSSSVHYVSSETTDSTSAGAAAGAGVPYARIHEFGGTIHHPGGTAYFISQLLGAKAFFVSNLSPSAAWLPRTRPHDIVMPERSYMRSSLDDKAPSGIQMLREAVKEAIAS